MAATLKFKSIWYTFFQAQNSMLIQKSVKPVDKFSNSDKDDKDSQNSQIVATTSPIDDYRIKREKNNESVRKSRAKNRVKLQECAVRVKELKDENVELNTKLSGLQTELSTLRNLFQYCFSFNSNSMPVKPSEIPTSTLYKMIMQNKNKFMSPMTTNLTEVIQQQTGGNPASLLTSVPAPITETQLENTNFESVLEQSRLLSLDDLDATTTASAATTTTTTTKQQFDQNQIFDEKDALLINELKQSLIDFIKYDDSPLTQSASASGVSSPFMSSPATPLATNQELLFQDDILIDNEDDMNTSMNFSAFLDDHDYSIKRAKFNI